MRQKGNWAGASVRSLTQCQSVPYPFFSFIAFPLIIFFFKSPAAVLKLPRMAWNANRPFVSSPQYRPDFFELKDRQYGPFDPLATVLTFLPRHLLFRSLFFSQFRAVIDGNRCLQSPSRFPFLASLAGSPPVLQSPPRDDGKKPQKALLILLFSPARVDFPPSPSPLFCLRTGPLFRAGSPPSPHRAPAYPDVLSHSSA